MKDGLYYDGPIELSAGYHHGPVVGAWLRWREGEGDLPAAILEALGVDEESLADSGSVVEVHARVHVTFDRAKPKEKSA